jgi:hypothetical protein
MILTKLSLSNLTVSPGFTILLNVISPVAPENVKDGEILALSESFFMLYVSLIQPCRIRINVNIGKNKSFLFIVGQLVLSIQIVLAH